MFSRRGNDYTERVPTIANAPRSLPVKSVTLDGEGVVCDTVQAVTRLGQGEKPGRAGSD